LIRELGLDIILSFPALRAKGFWAVIKYLSYNGREYYPWWSAVIDSMRFKHRDRCAAGGTRPPMIRCQAMIQLCLDFFFAFPIYIEG